MTTEKERSPQQLHAAINSACKSQFGVLDSNFLCRSVSTLDPKSPLCVLDTDSTESVLSLLRQNRIGCVVVTDSAGKVSGIFSERDCVLKVVGASVDLKTTPISRFMTPDPVCEFPDATIAYVLNLMSHGGFRHVPLIDDERRPVGMISVKDVVDHIVTSFVDDLLSFEAAV